MVLRKHHLDKFIAVQSCPSGSIPPIVFSPPGLTPSIHICIYLPTAGQNERYMQECVNLAHCIEDLTNKYPNAPLFIRGDANVNSRDTGRNSMLRNLVLQWDLKRLPLNHTTYHHFTGDGTSDSEIDVILHSVNNATEELKDVICKLHNPTMTSHHDALISHFHLNSTATMSTSKGLHAPKVPRKRIRIRWTEAGVVSYSEVVAPSLIRMRES